MKQVVALAKGKAWRRTLRRSRRGFGSGSYRPFAGRPPIIQPGMYLALQEGRRETAASYRAALAGDLEKRFPEDAFVKFTYAPYSVTVKASEIVRLHESTR